MVLRYRFTLSAPAGPDSVPVGPICDPVQTVWTSRGAQFPVRRVGPRRILFSEIRSVRAPVCVSLSLSLFLSVSPPLMECLVNGPWYGKDLAISGVSVSFAGYRIGSCLGPGAGARLAARGLAGGRAGGRASVGFIMPMQRKTHNEICTSNGAGPCVRRNGQADW